MNDDKYVSGTANSDGAAQLPVVLDRDGREGPDSRIEGQYVGSVEGENQEHNASRSRPWSHFA